MVAPLTWKSAHLGRGRGPNESRAVPPSTLCAELFFGAHFSKTAGLRPHDRSGDINKVFACAPFTFRCRRPTGHSHPINAGPGREHWRASAADAPSEPAGTSARGTRTTERVYANRSSIADSFV